MFEADTTGSVIDADQHALQLKIEHLMAALDQILHASSAGLSEYELLRELQAPEWAVLEPIDFRDPARLYPVHFLVFHALYRLREHLLETRDETLSINVLGIAIRPRRHSETALPGNRDALAAYYLDLDNLHLGAGEIDRMLDNFWRGVQSPQPEQLEEACHTLDIECPPENVAAANRQFRRLAMAHHPDRGGDSQRLQRINQAIAVVRQHFR